MTDEELIAEARRAGAELLRRPGAPDRYYGGLLKELADRLDGHAAAQITAPQPEKPAACPNHRSVLDSAAGWYCPTCGSASPP